MFDRTKSASLPVPTPCPKNQSASCGEAHAARHNARRAPGPLPGVKGRCEPPLRSGSRSACGCPLTPDGPDAWGLPGRWTPRSGRWDRPGRQRSRKRGPSHARYRDRFVLWGRWLLAGRRSGGQRRGRHGRQPLEDGRRGPPGALPPGPPRPGRHKPSRPAPLPAHRHLDRQPRVHQPQPSPRPLPQEPVRLPLRRHRPGRRALPGDDVGRRALRRTDRLLGHHRRERGRGLQVDRVAPLARLAGRPRVLAQGRVGQLHVLGRPPVPRTAYS